jgi:septum formation protein
VFIERIEGSYSGVMGLPLFETAALLAEAGVPVWQPAVAATGAP